MSVDTRQRPDQHRRTRPERQRPDTLQGVVLVTGTDTGVGKTIVTSAIAAAAGAAGLRVAVVKPAQTGIGNGEPSDIAEIVRLAAPTTAVTLAEYPDPLAPLVAAQEAAEPSLAFDTAVDAVRIRAESHDLVLVEGAGGLFVPMGLQGSGAAWTVADLAVTLGVPAVVVARAGLGTLNHTALTLEALHRRAVPAHVVIGAWPDQPERVHRTNLAQLRPHLVGVVPEGAGQLEPGTFRGGVSRWLAARFHGHLDLSRF